jgi:hypothetical protein
VIAGNYYTATTFDTDNDYERIWFELVSSDSEAQGTFAIRSCHSARVALSTFHGNTATKTYEVVIGGWDNTLTVIRRSVGGEIEQQAETPGVLDCDHYRHFWIRQEIASGEGHLEVGEGHEVGNRVLLYYTDPDPYEVKSVSVSTGHGAKGDWQVLHAQSMFNNCIYQRMKI